MDASYWDDLVGSTVDGHKWIAAFDILANLGTFAERMARQGSEGLFIIAGNRGTGDPPPPGSATWRVLDITGDTLMDGIRKYEEALTDLPQDVVEAVDAFDPDGTARVLRTVFAIDHPVAGRPSYGARPAAWPDALEDKVKVDELWDGAGIARAPSAIVPVDLHDLRAAADRLDAGMGTVWAGDARDGWHGGASHIRWVRDLGAAADAAKFFSAHCDVVRVMPFLDGIPCSIHGMVVGSEVIAFRPVELVILRSADKGGFFYAGTSTAWQPSDADAAAMREAALRAGAFVRDHHGYRGAFNLDGVLTADGWLPTEFNARFSAGLATLQAGFEAPLYHLHLAMVEGEDLDYRPTELEQALLDAADEHRRTGFSAPVDVTIAEQREAEIVLTDDGARFADEGEQADGNVIVGPGPSGGFIRFSTEEAHHGRPSGPIAAAVLSLIDAEWALGIGRLDAAPELR